MKKVNDFMRHASFWLMFAYGFSLITLHIVNNISQVLP